MVARIARESTFPSGIHSLHPDLAEGSGIGIGRVERHNHALDLTLSAPAHGVLVGGEGTEPHGGGSEGSVQNDCVLFCVHALFKGR